MTEAEDVIRVLYDYTYADDTGEVTIKAGDIYRLVERTNQEWWQVYDPSEPARDFFFVPAQYVETVADDGILKTISDLDQHLSINELSSFTDNCHDHQEVFQTDVHNVDSAASQVYGDADGDYINLEQFREASGINPIVSYRNLNYLEH